MLVVAAAEIPRPRAELAAAKRDGDVGRATPGTLAVEKDGGAGEAATGQAPQGRGARNAQIAVDDAVIVRPEDAPQAVERPASAAKTAPPSEATAVTPRQRPRPEDAAVW
jgi:hypothetical protein